MMKKWWFGILTGGAMVALATNSIEADAGLIPGSGSTLGMLLWLGLGMVGLGMWGRKKLFQGTAKAGKACMNEDILKGK